MSVLIAIAGGSTLGIIAGKLFDLIMYEIKRSDDKTDELGQFEKITTEALQVILLDRIRYVGQNHLSAGSVDFDDRRIFNKMHASYKALNGNGDLDKLMKEVNKLPLKIQ